MGIFRRFLSGRGSGDFSAWAGGSPAATIFEAPGMVAANKPPVAARNCRRSIAKFLGAKFSGAKFFGAEPLGAESFSRFFKRVSLEKRSRQVAMFGGIIRRVRREQARKSFFYGGSFSELPAIAGLAPIRTCSAYEHTGTRQARAIRNGRDT